MRVYNTLSGQKEEFEPYGDPVRMYVCGVTPYSDAHVGHAMSAISFDIVLRYLEFRGYRVTYVQNFTDIDDKIIARGQRLGIPPLQLAQTYIEEFHRDLAALNVKPATRYVRATAEMPGIIQLIGTLIERGFAYPVEGDVYFRVSRDLSYGKLSHRPLDEMEAGARVDIDERKETPVDFALWKGAKPGEPSWESPWGPGRPGWHIECSAIVLSQLGAQIDIHGGGQDLIFPHHENEIAQSECATGLAPFVKYWMHNGLLHLGGEKMSKSLGNLVTIKEALRQVSADALRLFVLTSHYRSPLTFTDEGLAAAERGVDRLRAAVTPPPVESTESMPEGIDRATTAARERFIAAMDDDFSTPGAIAQLFELAHEINRARETHVPPSCIAPAQRTLLELSDALGLTLRARESGLAAKPFIELLINVRRELRSAKQWALADQIRQGLLELGITLEDRAEGTTWRAS